MSRCRIVPVKTCYLASTLALLAALLVAGPAWGQTDARVTGKIVDTDGNPVPGARVILTDTTQGGERRLETDGDGSYFGRGLRPQVYLVRVEADGYLPAEDQVKLNLGMNTVDLTVTPAPVPSSIDVDALNELFSTGTQAHDNGDWEGTKASLGPLVEQLADLDGEEATQMRAAAAQLLARAHFELQEFDATVAVLDQLLTANPGDGYANYWMGQAYFREQQYDEALPYFRRVQEITPQDHTAHFNTGVLLLQLGRSEEAVEAIRRALEVQPEFNVAYRTLGDAYLRAQDYEKAIENFRLYLEREPEAADRQQVEEMIALLEEQIG